MIPAEPETIALPGGTATVQWRRSARARRVSLRIDARSGQVVVTLPMRSGRAAGMALLTDNAAWVRDKLAALPSVTNFADGGTVAMDGILYRICHVEGRRGGAWLEGDTLCVAGEQPFLARRVSDFLRAEARRRFAAQTLAKARDAGLVPRRVTVKDTRTRWGSCSPDGVIMLCWRLIMAPVFVQDYVVAHEVAHLRHLNHGAAFWALVGRLSPHREAAVTWLHREGARLLRIG